MSEIAALVGGDVLGDAGLYVTQVASLSAAQKGEISFLVNPKYRRQLETTRASAVILSTESAQVLSSIFGDAPPPFVCLIHPAPYAAYARVAALLNPPAEFQASVHPSAFLESPVPASSVIGPQVVLGKGVSLGENVVLHAHVVLGDNVTVGDGTVLYPNVTVYAGCKIGKRAVIHAGVVIGADGFGFAPTDEGWLKIPQIGGVCIGDDVEIGANTTIDRGALSDTLIGTGCKLDNQIQIGHNCEIGEHTVIAGCVGIAGSTRIGARCAIGGAAMILGHLSIADRCEISPGTMVMKSITKSGKYTALMPLENHEHWLKNASHLRHLDSLAQRISALEQSIQITTPKE